ncbi:MAG: SMI1/KNR4 family protein [Pyrinomonadaceae bacterium]
MKYDKQSTMSKLESLQCGPAPQSDILKSLRARLDFKVDPDFIKFVSRCSGAEGFISGGNYLQIWSVEDMLALNPYYPDNLESHRLFFFGADGSNLGYAFDKTTSEIVSIDFLDIGDRQPTSLAKTFFEFIERL